MKTLKKIICLLLLIVAINIKPLLFAVNSDLEIYFFNPNNELEDTTLTLHKQDDDALVGSFSKSEFLINEAVWQKFWLTDFSFAEETYILKVKLGTEKSFSLELNLNEAAFSEEVYTFYLKDEVLAPNLEDFATNISYATFIDRTTIKFSLTNPLSDNDEITLLVEDRILEIVSHSHVGDYYLLKLKDSDELDFKKEYTLIIDGNDGLAPQMKYIRFDDVYNQGFFSGSFAYDGDDLGVVYTRFSTNFKLWAPTLKEVFLNLYRGESKETYAMKDDNYGIFSYEKSGDLKDYFYTFSFTRFGIEYEIIDPYAKYLSPDKTMGKIINLNQTNPGRFKTFHHPNFSGFYGDAVIYESSVLQLDNGAEPTYLNLADDNSFIELNNLKYSTGISHLKELGITHLALSDLLASNYSLSSINSLYASSAVPTKELNDLKLLIQRLNENGIRVILDLNLNNLPIASLELLMPGYYYEQKLGDLVSSDDTNVLFNTDHYMVNKYLANSIIYLIKEFRFSGLKITPLNVFTVDQVNSLWRSINEFDESFVFYGEFKDLETVSTSEKISPKIMDQAKYIGFIDEKRFTALEEGFFTSTSSRGIKDYILSSWTTNYNTLQPYQSFKRLNYFEELSPQINHQIKVIQLLSYGTPVIKGGEELNQHDTLRLGYHNKEQQKNLFKLYQDLITFRKEHASLKFAEHRLIKKEVSFYIDNDTVVYRIISINDLFPDFLIIHYLGEDSKTNFQVPKGLPGKEEYNTDGEWNWQIAFDSRDIYNLGDEFNSQDEIILYKYQSLVMHYGLNKSNLSAEPIPIPNIPTKPDYTVLLLIISGVVLVLAGSVGIFFLIKTTKKTN
ncbi:MAG: hypothetical protein GX149_03725 [Acholeplasmataceae bacterium]|jgi:hypothetical protein|nr:hypothetical protein [Acholeplasmataceae bacterium]